MQTSIETQGEALSIILVDDDDVDARGVERAFKKARVANPIIRARDGLDALELLRGENGKSEPTKARVLLVDLNMPRMNGIKFVQALREDPKLKPSIVFILTTSSLDRDKMAAYDLNVAGYIVKEKAGQDFLKLIDMLGCYRCIVELPGAEAS